MPVETWTPIWRRPRHIEFLPREAAQLFAATYWDAKRTICRWNESAATFAVVQGVATYRVKREADQYVVEKRSIPNG